jgi:SAM-dependent methyltransferase
MNKDKEEIRAKQRELASEFASRGDATGWFEELYKRAEGDNEKVSWADLEPNRFLRTWAERTGLKGDGRKALVVGCGLGDDAVYLDDLGFDVTAFDISPTAIEWARRLHADRNIKFVAADLFQSPLSWRYVQPPATAGGTDGGGFDFVLEVYTIQPLPIDIRPQVIDSIAAFPKPGGELVVVTRGREDDEETDQLPWPLSRADLKRFEENGLVKEHFEIQDGDEEDPMRRFVVVYRRPE